MKLRSVLGIGCLFAGSGFSQDVWEQPPIRYSETPANDPAGVLGRGFSDGSVKLSGDTPLERMRQVLALLKIPESSQILVFSKTSKQNNLISPWTPRAIYFSENAYAAYVPGGQMEIISHDPVLGPVFQVVDLNEGPVAPVMQRVTGECLSCHGTARTSDVPGVLVRSVFTDADGRPLLGYGSFLVDAATPLSRRWGGYYVTGSSSLPHLGNRQFRKDETPGERAAAPRFETVAGRVDAGRYPRATSDIVALLVLEHQCQVYNLMTAASYRYRRMSWMSKTFDAASNPDEGTAGKLADDDAKAIVGALLFKDAASLGDGVEGDETFQNAFTARFPKAKDGRSLAEFHLGSKLFANRCSHMIYSEVFRSMPERVKSAVVRRLRELLEGSEKVAGYEHLGKSERDRIAAILLETWPPYRL